MIRRYGTPPLRGRRYAMRPGVYAVLPRGDRVLLTVTDEVQLPGGGIDPGESPLRALYREVMEETGWHIAGPVRVGAFRRFVFMPEYDLWAEKLCHIYRATPVRPHGPPTEAGHRVLWVDRRNVAGLLTDPASASFLRGVLRLSRCSRP